MAGMSSYAISIVLWMYVLAKVNVSIAYPFQSFGYIVAAFISKMMRKLSKKKL